MFAKLKIYPLNRILRNFLEFMPLLYQRYFGLFILLWTYKLLRSPDQDNLAIYSNVFINNYGH